MPVSMTGNIDRIEVITSVQRRPRTRSALCVDRMKAHCPRRWLGQGLQPRIARWRKAPALTRAQPWTTPNNYSLSGYSRATTYKDYVDLYFVIAENHTTLPAIITSAEQKFGADFNSRLFLEQLVYIADLDDADIQFLKPLVTQRELVAFFEKRIREI